MKRRRARRSRVLLVFLAALAGAGGYFAHQRWGSRLPSAAALAGLNLGKGSPAEAPGAAAPAAPDAVPADFESADSAAAPSLALVIDDVGHDAESLKRLGELTGPLALAVLPDTKHAAEAALLARRKGWDLLVHLPMEPESGRPEPNAIGPDDTDDVIAGRVEAALDRVPGAIGANNHQGSRATADPRVARAFLRPIGRRGLFFVDSRTTAASVAEREARALGIPTARRDVFLDDAATGEAAPGGTPEALRTAWEAALHTAREKGSCVVIGHPHRETLDFLERELAHVSAVRLVKVSSLVD